MKINQNEGKGYHTSKKKQDYMKCKNHILDNFEVQELSSSNSQIE